MHLKQLKINLSNFNFDDAYRNPPRKRDRKTLPYETLGVTRCEGKKFAQQLFLCLYN